MIEQSLKSNTKRIRTENIQVVYNLIFTNALYSLECYKEGNNNNRISYCYVENITDDEDEAIKFLHLIAKGKVSPVHICDIANDYFEDNLI